MQIYFIIENVRTCNYLQRTCKYILRGLSDGFLVVSAEFPWLSLVILGYRWLYTIQIYVKSFAHLQLSFPSFAEIFPVFCRNLSRLLQKSSAVAAR